MENSRENELNDKRCKLLVKALKVQTMSSGEMLDMLQMPRTIHNRGIIRRLIDTISINYPVFEPIPAQFKILTEEDIEEYQDLYRRQKC